ncbi:hypothetical protein [Candidatus Palauibacter sp.]|uniref:hypothetical protein n=1 Tax=Candidatus Palauibacter sp. TaxID=3101350 RepID=UPI003D10CE60
MMRRRRNIGTPWPLAAARVLAGALALSLVQPSGATAQSGCGKYISGGPNYPASGILLGSHAFPLDFGFGLRLTFSIGTYRMHDDSHIYVPCGFQ